MDRLDCSAGTCTECGGCTCGFEATYCSDICLCEPILARLQGEPREDDTFDEEEE